MGVNAEPRKPALARLAYISASGLIRTAGRPDAALVEMSTAGSDSGKDLWLSREARVPVRKRSATAAGVDHLLQLCRREFGHDLENGAGFGNRARLPRPWATRRSWWPILSMRYPA